MHDRLYTRRGGLSFCHFVKGGGRGGNEDMMTEKQFDDRLGEIEKEHADRLERADARHDQQLSRLFKESGRSQEWIAGRFREVTGKKVSRVWVTVRLRFGRFLMLVTS